ncbi:MAG: VOC family protein [Acidimicrobiia bacterium]|nr:VOC family protein [Acidimicrobiia bacterium]
MAYPHGLFSWADIASPDPEAAKAFYTGLFGWETADQHFPDGSLMYVTFSKGGKAVAGLGPQPPELTEQGVPPMWNSYVTVNNVDDTIEKWTAAGGSVMMPAMDVMTSGRMAFVVDPEGASVGLWQAGDSVGGEAFHVTGGMSWNELNTRDVDAARDFYGKALGWEFEAFEGSDPVYWLVLVPGKEQGDPLSNDPYNGGMLTIGDTFPPEMPAHWAVYFTVPDVDASVAQVGELGGNVLVEPFDTGAGRIAVAQDPQGGTFLVIQPPAQS